MKKNPKRPRPPAVLDSANWVSESSVQSPGGTAAGSGSGGPPSCEACRIDFLEDEVKVAWIEGGTYSAAGNVDTSGGGWEPDSWSLEVTDGAASSSGSETDATIGNGGRTDCWVTRLRNSQLQCIASDQN